MTEVLEKVRQLENYLEWRGGYADSVMDLTIDKVMQRERTQMEAQLARLTAATGGVRRSVQSVYTGFLRAV